MVLLALLLSAAGVSQEADRFRIKEGFRIELVHDVTSAGQGSWVCLTADPKGRLITSDQYGGLYRVTLEDGRSKVERIDLPVGGAQGLCWAGGSLYAVVATLENEGQGLYRVRDTDGDDRLDEVKLLRSFGKRRSEHGPHAVVPAPDGESLYIVAGNHTAPIEFDVRRVPPKWGEDDLLPRLPANKGSERGTPAPGGWIARTDLEGRRWEWVAMGLRNAYDLAFNAEGELFTYDADAEFDLNTPWYRPTRIYHVVSGAEYGWRNGAGKWPADAPDVVPPVVEMGSGSPTGLAFGTGAKFPAAYQRALFACDWSYGRLYVVHLDPKGATYSGRKELFLRGSPMPIADLAVNPQDGALYFVTGGRRTRSGLYRIVYAGDEPTEAVPVPRLRGAIGLRRELEAFHGRQDTAALEACWPYLGHSDRAIRYAARVAIEHQPVKSWSRRALDEEGTQASLTALLALARTGDASHQKNLFKKVEHLDWDELHRSQRFEFIRVYRQSFIRMGRPSGSETKEAWDRFREVYPSADPALNADLCEIQVYLEAEPVVSKTLALLKNARTQEEQLEYLKSLRHLERGWTLEQRKEYFRALVRAAGFKGGLSLRLFVDRIRKDAESHLSDEEVKALEPILEAEPPAAPGGPTGELAGRKKVRAWTVADVAPAVKSGLRGRDFARGKRLFAAAGCFACHRFRNEGGAMGPDLTGAGGRFGLRDLLEATVDPSRAINDQFAAVEVTKKDGKKVRGQIINSAGDRIILAVDLYDPGRQVRVERKEIRSIEPSKVSMMPTGLVDILTKDEILDLLAYLVSGGDPEHRVFQ